jgi:hypothetical protein
MDVGSVLQKQLHHSEMMIHILSLHVRLVLEQAAHHISFAFFTCIMERSAIVVAALMSAPRCRSNSTTASLPHSAALMSGVQPYLCRLSILARASSSFVISFTSRALRAQAWNS